MRQVGAYQVDGHEYKIGHWTVDKANENFAFLLKTFGDGMLAAISNPEGLDVDLGSAVVKEIIDGIFNKLSPKEYVAKMREYTAGILCDGKQIEYNTHFTGRIFHLHKVVFHVLKHQYSDFLDAIPAEVSELRGTDTERQTSIG